jgi:hypothetical protein
MDYQEVERYTTNLPLFSLALEALEQSLQAKR